MEELDCVVDMELLAEIRDTIRNMSDVELQAWVDRLYDSECEYVLTMLGCLHDS